MRQYFILFVFSLLLGSCTYDKESELIAPVDCDLSDTKYSTTINPLIVAKCATSGCHDGGGNPSGNFNNYNSVNNYVQNGKFENRVLVLEDMPPGESLTECEKQQIQQWLDNGAQNN